MSAEAKSTAKLGYPEYLGFPQDGRRHEIIAGEHYVNPAPEIYHQTLSRRIQFQLYTQIELNGLGQVFNAPTDVQLSDSDIVQPDLIVVLKDKLTIFTPTKIMGAPDIVVEILSTSTAEADRRLKKELYRKSGVVENWIVDPAEHTVEQFLLSAGSYTLLGRHADHVELQVMSGVVVNLSEVW